MTLLDKLAAADKGGRELDAEICALFRVGKKPLPQWLKNWDGETVADKGRCRAIHSNGDKGVHWEPLPVTTSIDASLELVPDGWEIERMQIEEQIVIAFRKRGYGVIARRISDLNYKYGFHELLPISIVLAALRAREQDSV